MVLIAIVTLHLRLFCMPYVHKYKVLIVGDFIVCVHVLAVQEMMVLMNVKQFILLMVR